MELQRLRADHASALLAFELENREYFAGSIPDRGDEYFAGFDARHAALLAEQETGTIQFHLLVDDAGQVIGRMNLIDVADGAADLGYRIAEKAAGRGVATAAVKELLALAAAEYGLESLRAATTVTNLASQTVLTRCGFVPSGEVVLSGKPGITYTLRLRDSGGERG
ncbi:GNAT family N-acetyltransferase [Kribbella qitaiheensis]|uniref:GNAT family N-acetyltransferase n=1 Tax=Kribbella qitaiheensis TaxID=1544730 RepID=A0A7G6X8B5_9ACTN|nr:GNAT family N-acetyltransferase [Kribbella qitaiheensis]QNE22480.1 GNAT family N-acetyltransferase [Kribbella qitaiheensis]